MRNLKNWKFSQFLTNFISDKSDAKYLKFRDSILSPVKSYHKCLFYACNRKQAFFATSSYGNFMGTLGGKRLILKCIYLFSKSFILT